MAVRSPEVPVTGDYIENGILFFISNKMNFMVHEDIVDICKSFYDENDIATAKTLMYDKYNCAEKAKIHRGSNKALNDLKEMINFMAQSPAPECIFCITKCTQVPSVVMDFVDAAAMNRHITNLRGEVTVSAMTLQRLMSKVEQLESRIDQQEQLGRPTGRNEDTISPAPLIQQDPPHSFEEQPRPTRLQHQQHQRRQNKHDQTRQPGYKHCGNFVNNKTVTERRGSENNELSYRDVLSQNHIKSDCNSSDSESNSGWEQTRHQRRKTQRRLQQQIRGKKQINQRRTTIVGTRKNPTLIAAQQFRDINLFVSRLPSDVNVEILRAQVKENAGVLESDITCELQPQKHANYRTCKVIIERVPKERIACLYDPENWDENILVRRWFDQLTWI